MKFTGNTCLWVFSFVLIFLAFSIFADVKLPQLNLYNKEGLTASPFQSN